MRNSSALASSDADPVAVRRAARNGSLITTRIHLGSLLWIDEGPSVVEVSVGGLYATRASTLSSTGR